MNYGIFADPFLDITEKALKDGYRRKDTFMTLNTRPPVGGRVFLKNPSSSKIY